MDIHDQIIAGATRKHDAELAQREAEARAQLATKVRSAMEAADKEGRLIGWDCFADETIVDWDALAHAAVDVFIDYLRNAH